MEYLFGAYTVIWVLIFGYTLSLGKRQKKLEEELGLLQRTVK
ncbi:CcmD family protein [Desulfitispora alkaliphila]